ncbi:PREDICTED: mini-chromosome maintenance complex-binding protein [Erythranthe guttata]|uniref:mini-chromosome maintenance complex-binding protein n=1 Tax=Erythranthe guttata TaxID=4155 RepID=UPI00064D84A6|nr:PREDICTED: mini-chromosome maintenance complex-binding protein [Erythranthe guttata]|eukprot:XP_012840012.1 PREDICTED: mini-chromosome maintenance complex-binding protein [Erythranthe guttata]
MTWTWREKPTAVIQRGKITQPPYIYHSLEKEKLRTEIDCLNLKGERETKNRNRISTMVGLPYDCLANPLGAVRLTFEKAVGAGSDPAALDGKDWGTADLFRQFLFDDGALSQVPILNPSTIKRVQPNTLVRFRGMIQDMLGNEFYVGAYKDGCKWRTNKFADASPCPVDASSDSRIWERQLLYCVPVPGQNSWVESSHESIKNPYTESISPPREKRPREDDSTMADVDMVESGHVPEDSPNLKKMREDGRTLEPSDLQMIGTEGKSSNLSLLPDLERNSFPCLVKTYDSPESSLKLNDVFEFIGIFSFDTDLTVDRDNTDELEEGFCEDALVYLPPAKVPRLHCIVHRKIGVNDFLSSPCLELTPSAIREVREALLGNLTAVLGNDRVAAQYVLLHLLSRVHARVDSIAVGKLSLNLTSFNKESISVFANRIKLAVENILPFTECLPLTVDYLNTVSLAPKKDYTTNRLASGFLQLAAGSHLTIDETTLQSGTLNSTGVENVRVLKNMMQTQKVEYDFTYYKMEMAADVQVLILSEGKSNILPADLVVPFRPSAVDPTLGVNGEMLKAWRWYLATMKSLPHAIEPHMQKVVEDDLVAARQADRSLGSQEFSRWLTMGRLMSISFGETSLSMEHWQMVKELETLRKERST